MLACSLSPDRLNHELAAAASPLRPAAGASKDQELERKITGAISQLESRLRLLERQNSDSDRQACEVARLLHQLSADQQRLASRLDGLDGRVEQSLESLEECLGIDGTELRSLLQRGDAMEARLAGVADTLEELRQQFTVLTEQTAAAAARARRSEGPPRSARGEAPGGSAPATEERRDGWHHGSASGKLLQDLQQQCNVLQELVDQRLTVSLWNVERQLPEAVEKVERVMGESAEHFAKLQEHEVRLNLALTKLGMQEQRIQNWTERIDRLPTSKEARVMWRDEVRKQLQDMDVEGLSRRVEMLSDTVEELSIGGGKAAL